MFSGPEILLKYQDERFERCTHVRMHQYIFYRLYYLSAARHIYLFGIHTGQKSSFNKLSPSLVSYFWADIILATLFLGNRSFLWAIIPLAGLFYHINAQQIKTFVLNIATWFALFVPAPVPCLKILFPFLIFSANSLFPCFLLVGQNILFLNFMVTRLSYPPHEMVWYVCLMTAHQRHCSIPILRGDVALVLLLPWTTSVTKTTNHVHLNQTNPFYILKIPHLGSILFKSATI